MSTKSYTLADGSTATVPVTVSATQQVIPFNEGMQALTKAIKACVSVRDGSGSGGGSGSSKLEPTLTVSLKDGYINNSYDKAFKYTYNGDGHVCVSGFGIITLFSEFCETGRLLNEYRELINDGYSGTVGFVNTKLSGTTVDGYFVIVHATEGENYASKTAWAEEGYFYNSVVSGTIYEFAHNGTF